MSSIGSRIKRYEAAYSQKMTPRSPLIIRVDGRTFHTYTRMGNIPFDANLVFAMQKAALQTARELQGFKLAYIQSDECTFLLADYETLETQGWFDYELNKVVSISASLFTAHFNRIIKETPFTPHPYHALATFDSRAFIVPRDDVPNVFVWRQQDWERNSLQMLARSAYSHKELIGKNREAMHEMLFKKGLNWAKLEDVYKNGTYITQDYQMLHQKLNYQAIDEIIGDTRQEEIE